MKPMRVAILVLVALAMRAGASPEKSGSEREEREREERKEREGNRSKDAEKGPTATDAKEALYAMGAILGAKVGGYALSPKELRIVERGFADAAAHRKLMLRDPDLDEWGPKVDAFLGRRRNPRVAAEKDRGGKVAEQMAKERGATTLPSGVVVVIDRKGDGPQPSATDRVRVKYEGRLIDGKSFDSSESAEFRLNQIIQCWAEGVQRVNVGGKARLVCPPATAYGDQGRPPQIPPGATLVFTVELLGIGGK
jgi:FKBP-type peptidyl-prolyl cis-trans isomerase FkpA